MTWLWITLVVVVWATLVGGIIGVFRYVAEIERKHSELVRDMVSDQNQTLLTLTGASARQETQTEADQERFEEIPFDDEFPNPPPAPDLTE